MVNQLNSTGIWDVILGLPPKIDIHHHGMINAKEVTSLNTRVYVSPTYNRVLPRQVMVANNTIKPACFPKCYHGT